MSLKNQAKIQELLEKGVENIYPNKNFLNHLLNSGKKLTLYMGIDPTGPELHIGHTIPLRKLRAFQDLGHQVIVLIGNFTALCGDPDKSHTRLRLTKKEIDSNLKNYKIQIGKILNLKGKNAALFKFNFDWLSKLKFATIIDIAAYFTVQNMLTRDLFQRRLAKGNPIHLHEFLYPLMQAYDSVHLNVDGEIGGNDQTFNMLSGRELMSKMKKKEKFVLTTKLLEDSTGKKMGKTEGNMITLADSPQDMFGKIMNWPDNLIIPGFELCTNYSLAQLAKLEQKFKSGVNPRDLKIELATEIVNLYHSKSDALNAQKEFEHIFRHKDTPAQMEKIFIMDVKYNLVDLILSAQLVSSKSEAKRLIEQGGVTLSNQKITDWRKQIKPSDGAILKVGKRKFVELKIKK